MQKKTQGMDIPILRQVNGRAVLEAVRINGQMGRKEIAEVTNLSIPTVWRLVNDLMKEGILTEVPDHSRRGTKGRRTTLVDIHPEGGWILALDLGANHIKSAIIDLAGKVHESYEDEFEEMTGEESVSNALISVIDKRIKDLELTNKKPFAIGISCPGTVDSSLGIIKLSFNLQLENYHIADFLTSVFDIPVFVANNIQASAIAEARFGHGRDNPNFAYVSIGYGVGAAYIFNREIYINPSRGEFGLMVVAEEGDPLRFGGKGYLEAIASGRGIASSARRAIESGQRTILSSMIDEPNKNITAKHVAEAASKGDEVALRIMERAATCLGIAIVNVANVLGQRLFVINGGVSKSGPVFWDPLRNAIEKYEYWPGEIQIEPSAIISDAAIIGAGLLALDKKFYEAVL